MVRNILTLCFYRTLTILLTVPLDSSGSGQSGSSASGNRTITTVTTNGGLSAGAVGGAVAGVAVGILATINIFFFLAKKKGWIMTRADCEKLIDGRLRSEELKRLLNEPVEKGVAQVDGGQIYQMP